ncbi:MAG: N-acetylmuramoyl-L-alanine amidase [Bacteroidales bacterium]|nr:N-acetylmuramoyl-L-alanine amidase [Clostridium sp.]MCM1203254.1 N-acetylmuramoyl-L-alanine amidase [Bacteroidales bacterium]
MRGFGKWIFWAVLFFWLFNPCGLSVCADTDGRGVTIALDAGHGGEEDGAYYYGIKEKDANLAVAKRLKQELEQYSGVTVVLVRDSDEQVTLAERANRAKETGADILLSLHFNASVSHRAEGASVYISTGEEKKKTLMEFADYLLGEFEALGLKNAGTFARVTQMGGRRADGSFDDYYGVLRHAYNHGIPAMIIEHCYMDAKTDRGFLQSEEKLAALAKADANGIAAYFQLRKKDGSRVTPRHARKFGAGTKAIERDYYEAPNITGIRMVEYDGKTPGIATYEIEVEDGVGISSVYLVYRNPDGNSVTVSLKQKGGITTGCYQMKAYIPEYLKQGRYTLSYIGAGNEAGFDAGYNYGDGEMIGFGKCDWLNRFSYGGEADFTVEQVGSISTAHARMIDYEIEIGVRDRRNRYFWVN